MTLAIPSRRGFLLGAGALLAAPAIVRVSSLMPVSVVETSRFIPSLWADDVEITVTIQQYSCLYGYTDKVWELRS